MTDLGDEVLLPGERLVSARTVEITLPARLEDPDRVLAALSGVDDPTRIGDSGPALAAGTPPGNEAAELNLFSALFGRDSLIVADLVGDRYPRLAEATIRRLAELQATDTDPSSEAEPGRIPHEVRHPGDPLSVRLTEAYGWTWPFYGSVDATPLFVLVASQVEDRSPGFLAQEYTDREGNRTTLAEAVARAMAWILDRLDSPSGLIESRPALPGGHVNQVWKDSFDSYHHENGTLATPGTVGSVEVAANAFDALLEASRLVPRYPGVAWPAPSPLMESRAERLRSDLIRLCWVDDGRYFAIGADRGPDGASRPLRVRTSNMGRLLDSEILAGPDWRTYAEAIVAQISSQDLLAAAGVRTLAAGSARYRPGSYHNGSVWPYDTRLVARGMIRHGHDDLAADLDRRIVRVVETMRCYPEFVRGDGARPDINRRVVEVADGTGRVNRVEQPPQLLQAWTVAAVISTGLHVS